MAEKEYIEKSQIIRHLTGKSIAKYPTTFITGLCAAADEIRCFTVADVVEVVRCKDCQYAKPYERNDGQMGYYCQHQNCTFLYGTNWERLFEPIKEANDFCSYGERRTEND